MSHRVHKVAFCAVENDDGDEQCHEHEQRTVEQTAPAEGAATHATVFEGFEDGCERIEFEDGAYLASRGAHGIDDRSGVHEQLDAEPHQLSKVAIFRSERGNDKPP